MIGRDVVGHVVEHEREPARGELRARLGQPLRPAEALVDDVLAHAVRRPDHVVRFEVGRVERKPAISPGSSRAIASPAGERRQTPISQTASTGRAASASHSAAGTASSVPTAEPHGRVDLVDGRARGQAHLSSPDPRSAPDLRARPPPWTSATRRSRSTRSGGSRRGRRRCRHGSTRGTAAGRANAGRSGTSRCPPNTGRRPCSSSVKVRMSRPAISSATSPRCSWRPDPVGYSTLNASP